MKRRFYLSTLLEGDLFTLSSSESYHLKTVLRAKAGEELILFDGKGKSASGTIFTLDSSALQIQVGKVVDIEVKRGRKIHLALCFPKEKSWDLSLRSAVELGVTSIHPLISERSRPLPSSKWKKKEERWQKIAWEACKQCGSNLVPKVHPISKFMDFPYQKWSYFFLYGDINGASLGKTLEKNKKEEVTLIIGPEGGLSEKEKFFLEEKNALSVSIGEKILRVETAVVSMISRILFWDEMQ